MGKYFEIKSANFSQVSLTRVNVLRNGPEILQQRNTVYLVANGASAIYYTTDGTTPTVNSTLYTQPLTIADTTTIKALAVINGSNTSVSVMVAKPYVLYEFQKKVNEGEHSGSSYDYNTKSRFHFNIPSLENGEKYRLQIELSKQIPATAVVSPTSSTFTARLTSSDSVNTGTDIYVAGQNQFNGLDVEFTAESTNPWLYLYFDTSGITTTSLPDDTYSFKVYVCNIF